MLRPVSLDCSPRVGFRPETAHALGLAVAGELADVDALAEPVRLNVIGRASGRNVILPSLDYRNHVANLPELVSHASSHRGSDFQGLMDADEIVEPLVQRDRVADPYPTPGAWPSL